MFHNKWALVLAVMSAACGTSNQCDSEPDVPTGAGGSTSSTTGAVECDVSECESDADCGRSSTDCASSACVDGVCKGWDLPPDYSCQDDMGAPGQCWGGQCCYTCIADLGSDLDKIDIFDGPCMAGNADKACGNDGQLCQDCALAGNVCEHGQCVPPPPL